MTRLHTKTSLLIAALAVAPNAGSAQAHWAEASTLGYGAVGLGLGVAACYECDYTAMTSVVVAGTVLGVVFGNQVGAASEHAAREGLPQNQSTLTAARVGSVLGFAALGVVAGGISVRDTEGHGTGKDERAMIWMGTVGALVGLFVEAAQGDPRVRPTPLPARFAVDSSPVGGVSLGLSLSTR